MKKTKQDLAKQQAAFDIKVEEFSKLSLDKLKELYNTNKYGGTYKEALLFVVENKLKEEALQDAIKQQSTT